MLEARRADLSVGVNICSAAIGSVADLKILIYVTHNKNLSKCSVLFVISAFYSIYFSDASKILEIFKYSFMPNEHKIFFIVFYNFISVWHSVCYVAITG
jgi:hypothetical protein